MSKKFAAKPTVPWFLSCIILSPIRVSICSLTGNSKARRNLEELDAGSKTTIMIIISRIRKK
jgi:hypothetical protein